MATPEEQLKAALKAAGYSATATRAAVFGSLQGRPPQTMHQLVAGLHGTTDRASIYRTIELFEKLHITERISIGWKYKIELSDLFSHHHHHIICTSCGRIDELHEDAAIEATLKNIADTNGYKLASHQIELRGICKSCQNTTI